MLVLDSLMPGNLGKRVIGSNIKMGLADSPILKLDPKTLFPVFPSINDKRAVSDVTKFRTSGTETCLDYDNTYPQPLLTSIFPISKVVVI